MKTEDIRRIEWDSCTIAAGFYCNPEPLQGFQITSGPKGNPIHPESEPEFESQLLEKHRSVSREFPELKLKRVHFSMPVMEPDCVPQPADYQPVAEPVPLQSTTLSAAWLPNAALKRAEIGYHYQDLVLRDLAERIEDTPEFEGLCSNLGYFMTQQLNTGTHPWAHNKRYPNPEHQLPTVLSYLGFYYFDTNGEIDCGFAGVHAGAVGVTKNGRLELLPEVSVDSYQLIINGAEIEADIINPAMESLGQHPVALFTPALELKHDGELIDFAPLITTENRINLFISNRGNGHQPGEFVIKVWQGEAPLPSFGVVLSVSQERFRGLGLDIDDLADSPVKVIPRSGQIDFEKYRQILGGLVPAVVDGKAVVSTDVATLREAELSLDAKAATLSAFARSGKETNNFDAYIREPAGLILQTENGIGWLLFDGRHELSIGANIVDVANLVARIQMDDIDLFEGETICSAMVLDGGSAMKLYAIAAAGKNSERMTLLNRVAAGGRNGPGSDSRGLNLYSTVRISL